MSISDQISELLVYWEEEREQGRNVSAEELCGGDADLVAEVRRRIAALEAMYGIPNQPGKRVSTLSCRPSPGDKAAEFPQVAGYRILELIGHGGMGVVYKALHINLNRVVALKMILSGPHAAAHELARFRAEAEAVARLQHPNIVQIYEVGEQDGRAYFSLEFVEGGSLGQALEGKPLPPTEAAMLVESLARAMHYAHQRGIVHRDLKPGNILLQRKSETSTPAVSDGGFRISDFTPKVTDFGLAKRLGLAQGQTQSGSVLGTPNYMAPEQAAGKIQDIGPRTDVYALGAILYEFLTGRPPFEGESLLEVIERVQSQEPLPPRSVQPATPVDLETICLACLRKEPELRYPTALALADDVQRFLTGELIQARKFTVFDRLARTLNRSREIVEFDVLAGFLIFFVPVPFLSHLLVTLLFRGEPSFPAAALGVTIGNFLIVSGLFAWLIHSRKLSLQSPIVKQFWAVRIAQLSGMVLTLLLCWQLAPPGSSWQLNVYPFWAVLTGMTFFSMASNVWGRLYLAGIGLFGIAAVLPLSLEWAPLVIGTFISCFMTAMLVHFRSLHR
jgi:serine/threonine protein kinase